MCALCHRPPEPDGEADPPLGWSLDYVESREGPRQRWVCVECTRRFVRSIEAKLDHDWWE